MNYLDLTTVLKMKRDYNDVNKRNKYKRTVWKKIEIMKDNENCKIVKTIFKIHTENILCISFIKNLNRSLRNLYLTVQ